MSLAAAVLVGASAFAIDNVKVSGNAQVFYNTNDQQLGAGNIGTGLTATNKSGQLFNKDNSAADAGLNLNISADLAKNSLVTVSAGAGYTVLSTLGLENNFVSNVWGDAHGATVGNGSSYGAKVENANWMNEAWVAVSLNALSKSTVKVGRMELDTPLAFTEKWSIEKNTFEAAVLINQDIPDTTLVGAYVGNGNGTEPFTGTYATPGSTPATTLNGLKLAVGGVVNTNGDFGTYGVDGAYAIGAINNSFKPLTVQAWYYDVSKLAQAYWLQADLNIAGILAGAQYANEKVDSTYAGGSTKADDVYALMLGYEMKDVLTAKVAYSSVNDNGTLGSAGRNTATATRASKLYTEAWWSYGYVTQSDTNSWNVSVTSPVKGILDLGLYYTNADQGTSGNGVNNDMTEFTATLGKKFGPLDATLAYSNIKATNMNSDSAFNQVQAYLTLNF